MLYYRCREEDLQGGDNVNLYNWLAGLIFTIGVISIFIGMCLIVKGILLWL